MLQNKARSFINVPQKQRRMSRIYSMYSPHDNKTVFQLCPVPKPNTITEIEDCLISTHKQDYKSISDAFTNINVNYNQVIKWFAIVRNLEDLYTGRAFYSHDDTKGIFDLCPSQCNVTNMDDIEHFIIHTKKNNDQIKSIKFASVNLNYENILQWYPIVSNLERQFNKI